MKLNDNQKWIAMVAFVFIIFTRVIAPAISRPAPSQKRIQQAQKETTEAYYQIYEQCAEQMDSDVDILYCMHSTLIDIITYQRLYIEDLESEKNN